LNLKHRVILFPQHLFTRSSRCFPSMRRIVLGSSAEDKVRVRLQLARYCMGHRLRRGMGRRYLYLPGRTGLDNPRACRSNCKRRPARYPDESKLSGRTLGHSAPKTGLLECSPHLPEACHSECLVETRRSVFALESWGGLRSLATLKLRQRPPQIQACCEGNSYVPFGIVFFVTFEHQRQVEKKHGRAVQEA